MCGISGTPMELSWNGCGTAGCNQHPSVWKAKTCTQYSSPAYWCIFCHYITWCQWLYVDLVSYSLLLLLRADFVENLFSIDSFLFYFILLKLHSLVTISLRWWQTWDFPFVLFQLWFVLWSPYLCLDMLQYFQTKNFLMRCVCI